MATLNNNLFRSSCSLSNLRENGYMNLVRQSCVVCVFMCDSTAAIILLSLFLYLMLILPSSVVNLKSKLVDISHFSLHSIYAEKLLYIFTDFKRWIQSWWASQMISLPNSFIIVRRKLSTLTTRHPALYSPFARLIFPSFTPNIICSNF